MRCTTACLPLVLLLGATACGGSSYEISDQVMTGQIGGQSWTFATGETDAFLSDGEDDFFALLYQESFAACQTSPAASRYLIVSVPKQPGEYDFGPQLNMTFVIGDATNLVATDGTIVVDQVTATTVTGGLHGVFDGDNEVDGQFTLTICQ